MTDIAFSGAIKLAAAISAGSVSSLELTDHYIDRIERLDGELNAVVVSDFDRARHAAREADAALARGDDVGPLHGVPMTIVLCPIAATAAFPHDHSAFGSRKLDVDGQMRGYFEQLFFGRAP